MDTAEIRKPTSLRLKRGLYEHVRERARKENRSINNFLEKVIAEAVEYREPNEETKQALDQAIRDRPYLGHRWYGSAEEMLEDLLAD